MSNIRNVILELRHSNKLHSFAATMAGAEEPSLDRRLVPTIAGLDLDASFAPIQIPGRTEEPKPRDAFDVGARFSLDSEPSKSTYIVRGKVDEEDLEEVEKKCKASNSVVGIYSDVTIKPMLICPGDPPKGTDQTVEQRLCVSNLHGKGMDGAGVMVAVVDTGVNMDYLNSKGKNPGFDLAKSWKPATATGTPGSFPVDHGTMVAYDVCIAAPNCTILDIALLLSRRTGGSIMEGFLSDAVLAYRHLLDIMDAERRPGDCRSLVVNNSWGMFHPSWDFPVGHPGNYSDNPNHPFNVIVGTLERAGADILFAAGNCGPDCPDGRCQGVTADVIYGANSHPQVLSIAGVDTDKDRVGYSSVGPGRLTERKPDVSGYTHFKGSGVYAADGGTSAACPVVSGVVAAIRSCLPSCPEQSKTSPAAVRNLLIKTAEDRGSLGYDFEYGWGIVNGCRLAEELKGCKEPEPKKECCCCCCCHCCKKCRCTCRRESEDNPDADLSASVDSSDDDAVNCCG